MITSFHFKFDSIADGFFFYDKLLMELPLNVARLFIQNGAISKHGITFKSKSLEPVAKVVWARTLFKRSLLRREFITLIDNVQLVI